MNTKRCMLLCCLVFSMLAAAAQRLNGISVEGNYNRIVVFLDGQQMCEGTSSCFIANLRPGTYHVEVFRADEMRRPVSSRRPLYRDRVRYSGRSIHRITVGDRYVDDHCDRYQEPGVMSKADFKDYCQALRRLSFDDNKLEMIDQLPRHTRFTSRQCRDIIHEFSFDNNRLEVLKRLYPRVVDQELFFKAIDALDFNSNKREMQEYIKRYNNRH